MRRRSLTAAALLLLASACTEQVDETARLRVSGVYLDASGRSGTIALRAPDGERLAGELTLAGEPAIPLTGSYHQETGSVSFASEDGAYAFAGGLGSYAGGTGVVPAGDAAFDNSLIARFNTTYNSTSASNWNVAPSNPTNANLFGSQTYTRSGRAYIALRQILGKDNFNKAGQEIQTTYGGKSITQPQQIAIYHKWMPNKSAECSAKLDDFFKQWWDTAYVGSDPADVEAWPRESEPIGCQ